MIGERAAGLAARDDANCAIELMEEGGSEETAADSGGITASEGIAATVVGRFVSKTIRSGHSFDDRMRIFGGFDAVLIATSFRFAARYASAMRRVARRIPPTTVKYQN